MDITFKGDSASKARFEDADNPRLLIVVQARLAEQNIRETISMNFHTRKQVTINREN